MPQRTGNLSFKEAQTMLRLLMQHDKSKCWGCRWKREGNSTMYCIEPTMTAEEILKVAKEAVSNCEKRN